MTSGEIWGPGPFDNVIAQALAFKLKTESTSKTLPNGLQRFEKPARQPADALEIIALAEVWNLVAGHSSHTANCPLLADWAVTKKIKPLGDGALGGVPAKLRAIAADPKTSKLFGKAAANWRAEVEKTAKTIEAGKAPRPIKPDAISMKTLKTVVAGDQDWDPGMLFPMAPGSHDVHINIMRPLTPQDALAMARYPSVVSMMLNLEEKSDEAANLIPFRLLLQRWCHLITSLECDVAPKSWNSKFLDQALPELEHLSKIEVFKSDCFYVTDAVVAALARSPALKEISISCEGHGPTAKALEALSGKKSLQSLWLSGARISKKEAAAFAKANPKMNVDINTY